MTHNSDIYIHTHTHTLSYILTDFVGQMFHFFQSGDLPCHFHSYDLDGNGDISAKEFMLATGGIGHIDSKELFGRLDKNGRQLNITRTINRFRSFIA